VAEKVVVVVAEVVPSGGTARKKSCLHLAATWSWLAKSKKAAWYSCCQPCHL